MRTTTRTPLLLLLFLCASATGILVGAPIAQSQELHEDIQGTWRARVITVITDEEKSLPDIGINARIQTLEAEILEGPRASERITLQNDFLPLKAGDAFFLNYLVTVNGDEFYSVLEPDRRGALFFFIGLFVLVVLVFGGLQGLRSLIALAGSFLILFYFLFPKLLAGTSPVLVSTVFAIGVLIFAIYITHGVNRKSTAALLGTIITILITIFLADVAVTATKLSGFVEEASIYLNLSTGGLLDFRGLLLGAIIIGVLGILDDIAITQAAAVAELRGVAAHLSHREIYRKALRIGKEHVGALVNTLALAYAGAALPLLLLFYSGESSLMTVNREIFAAEIIRTIVGSTAIILAVPITTAIAVMLLARDEKPPGAPGGQVKSTL
jgi:uncharacterized membrane protein